MPSVTLPDQLRHYAGGAALLDCTAANYRDLLAEIEAAHPGLGAELEELAVAIDGQIYQDALLEPMAPGSEVFFMPKIEGG